MTRVAILHGAGLAGGELVRILLRHPHARLVAVTSRTFAGQPVSDAHPSLRGVTDLPFTAHLEPGTFDAAFVCSEHRAGAAAVLGLRASGFDGLIVDLSADHRLADAALYPAWYGFEHPAPEALAHAVYGLADVFPERVRGARLVANPGCFATGISLALYPLTHLGAVEASVTALTGASGSGAQASAATHFPTRDGNVRAYKALAHQHMAEVTQTLGPDAAVHFVPASGPWTRGIWGTAHVTLSTGLSESSITEKLFGERATAPPRGAGRQAGGAVSPTVREPPPARCARRPPPGGREARLSLHQTVSEAFADAYAGRPLVRLSPGALPELLPTVGTPFCDIGWIVRDDHLVVGFALDNLVKGAAGQAVQNLNLALGFAETTGLLP